MEITEQDEREAVKIVKRIVEIYGGPPLDDNKAIPVRIKVLRALLARAQRSHD